MNITDIRIRKIYEDARLKALVSVTIDGDLAVHEGAAGIAVQAHAQILGKVGDGLRGGQLSYGAVLQGDFQHNNSSVSGNG